MGARTHALTFPLWLGRWLVCPASSEIAWQVIVETGALMKRAYWRGPLRRHYAVQAALAELKKGTLEVNPDEESLLRLKALRGEAPGDQPAPKAKPAFRTAQVRHWPFCEVQIFGAECSQTPPKRVHHVGPEHALQQT